MKRKFNPSDKLCCKTHKPLRQLCDWNSGYGALRCDNYGGCPGANASNCYPMYVWSGQLQSGTNYYYGNLNSGTLYASTGHYANYTNAYGVRCVLGFEFFEMENIIYGQALRLEFRLRRHTVFH